MIALTCPRCKAPSANDGWARVCYQCGLAFDEDGAARSALATRLDERRTSAGDDGTTVRWARAELGRALARAGDRGQAREVFGQALRDPGSQPCAADLHRELAALHLADGDVLSAQKETLLSSLDGQADALDLIASVRQTLTGQSAEALSGWLDTEWSKALRDAAPPLRLEGLVLRACVKAVLGFGTAVTDSLRGAAAIDPVAAQRSWRAWTDENSSMLSALPGGETYATTLMARAADALGDAGTARELTEQVITGGLTGEGFPELEAYWLRSTFDERSAGDRALDLFQVAERLRWRGTARDLDQALRCCDDATALAPDLVELHWLRAEVLRSRAMLDWTAPDTALLDRAIEEWEKGLARAEPEDGWPWLFGSLAYADAADSHPEAALTWTVKALRCAARCAMTGSGEGFAVLADVLRRLRIWPATRWAIEQCVRRVQEWTPDLAFTAVKIVPGWLLVDPRGLDAAFERLRPALTNAPDWANLFAGTARSLLAPDDAAPIDQINAAYEAIGGSANIDRLSFVAWRSAVAGDDAAARTAAAAMEVEAARDPKAGLSRIYDRAGALLWTGADGWRELRARMDDPQLPFAAADRADVDLRAALFAGDAPAARRHWPIFRAGSSTAAALATAWELGALASRLSGECAALAGEYAAELLVAAEEKLAPAAWDGDAVTAELDRLTAAAELSELRDALQTCRVLVADEDRAVPISGSDFWEAAVLELGRALVPSDAEQDYGRWVLFSTLIPQALDEVAEVVGPIRSGVTVSLSDSLGPSMYRVWMQGCVVASGEVEEPLGEPQPAAQWQEPGLWRQPVAALVRALEDHSQALLMPAVVRLALAEQLAPGAEAPDIALDAVEVVAIWRTLRADLGQQRAPLTRDGLQQRLSLLIHDSAGR